MADSKVHIQSVAGNLDIDSPIESIKNGDYVEAFNISCQTKIRKQGDKSPALGVSCQAYKFHSKIYPKKLSERMQLFQDYDTILTYDFGDCSAIIKQEARSYEEVVQKVGKQFNVYLVRLLEDLPANLSKEEILYYPPVEFEVIEMSHFQADIYVDQETSISGYVVDGIPVLVLANDKIGVCELRLGDTMLSDLNSIIKSKISTIVPKIKEVLAEPSYAPPCVTLYAIRSFRADGSVSRFSSVSAPVSIGYNYSGNNIGPVNSVYTSADFDPKKQFVKSNTVISITVGIYELSNASVNIGDTIELYAVRFFGSNGMFLDETSAMVQKVDSIKITNGSNDIIFYDGRSPVVMDTETWATIKEESSNFSPFDTAKVACCKEGVLYVGNVKSDIGHSAGAITFDAKAWQFNYAGRALTSDGDWYEGFDVINRDVDPERQIQWFQCDLRNNYNDMTQYYDEQTFKSDAESKYIVFGDYGYHGAVGKNITIYFSRGKMDVGGVYPEIALNAGLPNLDVIALDEANQDMSDKDNYHSKIMRGLCSPSYKVGGRGDIEEILMEGVNLNTGLKKHQNYEIGVPDSDSGDDKYIIKTQLSSGDDDGGHSFANPMFVDRFKSLQHDSVYYFGVYFTQLDGTNTVVFPIGDLRTPSMSDREFRLFDDHVMCESPVTHREDLKTLDPQYNIPCRYTAAQYTEIKAYPVYMYVELRNLPAEFVTAHIVYKKRDLANMNVKGTGVLHKAMKPFASDSANGDRKTINVLYGRIPLRGIYQHPGNQSGIPPIWIEKGQENALHYPVPDDIAIVQVLGANQKYYDYGNKYCLTPLPHIGREQHLFYGGVISGVSTDQGLSEYRTNKDGTIKKLKDSSCNKDMRAAGLVTTPYINCPEERALALGNYQSNIKGHWDGAPFSHSQYASYSGKKVVINSGYSEDILVFHCPEIDFTNSDNTALININYDDSIAACFNGHGFLTSMFPAGYDKGLLSTAYSELNDGFGTFYGENFWNEEDPITLQDQTHHGLAQSRGWFNWMPANSINGKFKHPSGVYDTIMITNDYTTSSRLANYNRVIPKDTDPDIYQDPNGEFLSAHYSVASTIQTQHYSPFCGFKNISSQEKIIISETRSSDIFAGGWGNDINMTDSDLSTILGYDPSKPTTYTEDWKQWLKAGMLSASEEAFKPLSMGTPKRLLKYFIRHTVVQSSIGGNLHVEQSHRAIIPINNTEEIDFGVKTFDEQFKYLWPCTYNKPVYFVAGNVPTDFSGIQSKNVGGNTFVNLCPLWSGKYSPSYNTAERLTFPKESIVSSSDRNRMHAFSYHTYANSVTQDAEPPIPLAIQDALVTPIADHGCIIDFDTMRHYREGSGTVYASTQKFGLYQQYSTHLKSPGASGSNVYSCNCVADNLVLESFDFGGAYPGNDGHVFPDVLWHCYESSVMYFSETGTHDTCTTGTNWGFPWVCINKELPKLGDIFNYDIWEKMTDIKYTYDGTEYQTKFSYWTGSVTMDYFCGVNHHGFGGRFMACTVDSGKDILSPKFLTEDISFPVAQPPIAKLQTGHHFLMLYDNLWDGSGRAYGDTSLYGQRESSTGIELLTQYKLSYNDPRPVNPTFLPNEKNNHEVSTKIQNTYYGIERTIAKGATVLMATYRTPAISYSKGNSYALWIDTTAIKSTIESTGTGLTVKDGQASGHIAGFDTFVGIHKKIYTHGFYPSMNETKGQEECATSSSPTIMMFPYEGLINVDIANELDDILDTDRQKTITNNSRQWINRDVTYKSALGSYTIKTDMYGYNSVFSTLKSGQEQTEKEDIDVTAANARLYYGLFNYLYKEFDIFRPGNYIDLDSQYGGINNMRVMGNNLFVLQESAVAVFNPQMPMTISGGQGQPVVFNSPLKRNINDSTDVGAGDLLDMGDGSLLAGRFQYIVKGYGISTTHTSSTISTDDGVYWIDTKAKALMRASTQGCEDIGKKYNINSWVAAVSEKIHTLVEATYSIYSTHDRALRFCLNHSLFLPNEDWYIFSSGEQDKRCIQLEEMGGGFNSFISFNTPTHLLIKNRGFYVKDDDGLGLILAEGGHNAYFFPSDEDEGMSITSFISIPGADILDKRFYSLLWRFKNSSSIDRILEARAHSPIGLGTVGISQVMHYPKKTVHKDTFYDGNNTYQYTGEMRGGSGEYKKIVEKATKSTTIISHAGNEQQGYITSGLSKEVIGVGSSGIFVQQRFQTFTPLCLDEAEREPESNKEVITPWSKRNEFYFDSIVAAYEISSIF